MTEDLEASGLTVAQMATATGVSTHTLRYYERAGLIHPIARTAGNQRRYSPDDVAWLEFLLRLRETGMPIAQMREYAVLRAQGAATTEARLALLETHRTAVRARIAALRRHEQALEAKIETYRHDLAAHRGDTPDPAGQRSGEHTSEGVNPHG
ncbi:MerR family transcriptional regulator [Raineyella sp. LH-20]|uniref:MerR family transcriptional regulator n=1 Tax=Raineyella sp. LH-20 TaxID=3081204 RepID=UPI0029558B1A|nr:MerR family transcriptional regulator [Raineyella sp. LH-20]WOP17352.1 MerR family transcriptional regulator [Raineyella sp. LH-20]